MPDVHDPDGSEGSTDTEVATVVYEDAHGDRSEVAVPTEHLAYREDHWVLPLVVDGTRRIRRVPRERVYHVDRPAPDETRAESDRKSGSRDGAGSDA